MTAAARLQCLSVHSVKGGVGKSTVATLTAVELARRAPDCPVYLIDMDLTGTSLADVLPLEAPRWSAVDRVPDPPTAPDTFWPRTETLDRIGERDDLPEEPDAGDARRTHSVPFLNDYLLFATPDWSAERDMPPEVVCWRLADGPSNLRVVPSSALPVDLERTLPVIFDEQHSAYLEGRLERFLAAVCRAAVGDVYVVFDVPPTIPGLSRSVLSLGLRLAGPQMLPLAEGGYIPAALSAREIRSRALMLTTLDLQDLRAMDRWMNRVGPEEQALFQVVVSRVRQGTDPGLLRRAIDDGLSQIASINPLMDDAVPLAEDPTLRIFGAEACPAGPFPAIVDLLDRLWSPDGVGA